MWVLSKSKLGLDERIEVWLQLLLESGELRKLGGIRMMMVMVGTRRKCDGA